MADPKKQSPSKLEKRVAELEAQLAAITTMLDSFGYGGLLEAYRGQQS
jgi:hypothetical protein